MWFELRKAKSLRLLTVRNAESSCTGLVRVRNTVLKNAGVKLVKKKIKLPSLKGTVRSAAMSSDTRRNIFVLLNADKKIKRLSGLTEKALHFRNYVEYNQVLGDIQKYS